jgi:hypothetical protein
MQNKEQGMLNNEFRFSLSMDGDSGREDIYIFDE